MGEAFLARKKKEIPEPLTTSDAGTGTDGDVPPLTVRSLRTDSSASRQESFLPKLILRRGKSHPC
jgi:hypothetical protein